MLFIDEIHRLQPAIEEVLYPAMEDFQLDLIIGEGPAARSVRIDLSAFTLVGATTRAGLLATPLRDRFGIPLRLIFYTPGGAGADRGRGAEKLGFRLTDEGASEIARRSRGTPRIAGRLLRRVRDFAAVAGQSPVTQEIADAALTRLEVDRLGLDAMDRRYLRRIAEHHNGGPVGVETLAAALAEARDTLEDVIEPLPDPGGPDPADQPRAYAGGGGVAATRAGRAEEPAATGPAGGLGVRNFLLPLPGRDEADQGQGEGGRKHASLTNEGGPGRRRPR